jgi:hypothetical protein
MLFVPVKSERIVLYDSHQREHLARLTTDAVDPTGECRLENGTVLDYVDKTTFKHPVTGALFYRQPRTNR